MTPNEQEIARAMESKCCAKHFDNECPVKILAAALAAEKQRALEYKESANAHRDAQIKAERALAEARREVEELKGRIAAYIKSHPDAIRQENATLTARLQAQGEALAKEKRWVDCWKNEAGSWQKIALEAIEEINKAACSEDGMDGSVADKYNELAEVLKGCEKYSSVDWKVKYEAARKEIEDLESTNNRHVDYIKELCHRKNAVEAALAEAKKDLQSEQLFSADTRACRNLLREQKKAAEAALSERTKERDNAFRVGEALRERAEAAEQANAGLRNACEEYRQAVEDHSQDPCQCYFLNGRAGAPCQNDCGPANARKLLAVMDSTPPAPQKPEGERCPCECVPLNGHKPGETCACPCHAPASPKQEDK